MKDDRRTGDGRGRLRRFWDWIVDAHLELPEDREVSSSKFQVPSSAAPPVEQEWQRRIRVMDEKCERLKKPEGARIG